MPICSIAEYYETLPRAKFMHLCNHVSHLAPTTHRPNRELIISSINQIPIVIGTLTIINGNIESLILDTESFVVLVF